MKQQLILLQRSQVHNSAKLREWQKYRGWKIRILEELENSGGMTTHEISTRIGWKSHATSVELCRMHSVNLVERVERWGWKITCDGLFLLSLNYVNTSSTQHQHIVNTTSTLEKEESAPSCFYQTTCHIKRFCADKGYTLKNMTLCPGCVWDLPENGIIAPVRVEKKGVG